MTTIAVVLLILLGLVLILLEFLVVPGVTIAGIGGLILMGGGVYMSYHYYGVTAGNYTLGGTIMFLIITLIWAFRSKTWKKLMLRSAISSKVYDKEEEEVKAGDIGITISRLNPMGKVLINDEYYEGKSVGDFIDENKEVIVKSVYNKNKVIVKLKEKL